MKNVCYKCQEIIDDFDFYVESSTGKICSSCLVTQKLPKQEVQDLFQPRRMNALIKREQKRAVSTMPYRLQSNG